MENGKAQHAKRRLARRLLLSGVFLYAGVLLNGASGGMTRASGRVVTFTLAGASQSGERQGRWVTDNFRPTCWGSDKLFLKTYLTATVVNSKGDPSCRGKYLNIANHSMRYSAFFGVDGQAETELKPREERTIPVSGPENPSDPASTTKVRLMVKYWVES